MTKAEPANNLPDNVDPLSVNSRLYKQISRLLEDMEQGSDVSLRQRIEAELNAKRATDATLRERIQDALAEQAPITTAERIRALMAIGRVQVIFAALRKQSNEPNDRGAAVRKYSEAFRQAPDAARRRARGSRAHSNRAIDDALAAAAGDDDGDEDDTAA